MANKSELIREFIKELFNQNHDFSNRELNKTKFVEHFESEANKEQGVSWKAHQTLFVDQFKIICKEKNISPSTYGYANEKKTFAKSETGAEWNTKPMPKQVATNPNPAQNPGISNQQSAGLATKSTEEKITPLTDQESLNLSVIVGKTIFNMGHAWKPAFAELDQEEATTLGAALNPILKPYFERYGGKFLTLAFVAGGIMTSKGRAQALQGKPINKDEKFANQLDEASSNEIAKEQKIPKSDQEKFEQWKKEHGN